MRRTSAIAKKSFYRYRCAFAIEIASKQQLCFRQHLKSQLDLQMPKTTLLIVSLDTCRIQHSNQLEKQLHTFKLRGLQEEYSSLRTPQSCACVNLAAGICILSATYATPFQLFSRNPINFQPESIRMEGGFNYLVTLP